MQPLEVIAAKQKFKRIQELNSELFELVHELSDEEYAMFIESEYVWPIETKRTKFRKQLRSRLNCVEKSKASAER